MNILVFGYNGQVATELRAVTAAGLQLTTLDRTAADLCDPAACAAAIVAHGPDAVINAAAYTAVDRAEEDEATAYVINAKAPAAMAQACLSLGIPFVTLSTDYVFAGTCEAPWRAGDPTGPIGAYGRTKQAGEHAVAQVGGAWAVLRTSWVVSAHGSNFVKTMLRLGAERPAISVVSDQIGGPTGAADIAQACVTIARTLKTAPHMSGVYYFAGAPDTSWADFARAIFAKAGVTCQVTDIPSTDYPTPAKRPLNSRMDCRATTSTFGIERPDWHKSLDTILAQLADHKA